MGAIQNSINYALGTAAIASGLTNKKQVEKAQDKLDKSEENLAKKEGQLAKTEKEKNEAIKQQAKDAKVLSEYKDEDNMKYGGNTFNVSNDLPTAKETNIDNAGDKIDVVSNNSTNDIKGPSIVDFLNSSQKANPYTFEQFMGSHALKILDSRVDAKRELRERIKSRTQMISPQARAERARLERENGGNK